MSLVESSEPFFARVLAAVENNPGFSQRKTQCRRRGTLKTAPTRTQADEGERSPRRKEESRLASTGGFSGGLRIRPHFQANYGKWRMDDRGRF